HGQADKDQQGDRAGNPAMTQGAGQQVAIAGRQTTKEALCHVSHAAFILLRGQQQGTHHRGQGQGHHTGYQHGTGQCQGKLLEECSSQATHQTNRGIDGSQRQRHGDYRTSHFTRAQQGGHHGRTPGSNMTVYVFNHYNRVVHDQTNSQHHGQQGQQVDAEAKGQHQGRGPQHGQGNGGQGNQHAAERTQAHVNHQHHDNHGFGQGLEYLINRGLNKAGGFKSQGHFYAGWQGRLNSGQAVTNAFHNAQGIAAGSGEQAQVNGGQTIHQGAGFSCRCPQFYLA